MMWNSASVSRWRFSRRLMTFTDENPEVTKAKIGQAMAKAVGREKPYSTTWIGHMIAAARKFPDEPKTEMERRRFNAAVQCRKELRPTLEYDRARVWNNKERCVKGVVSLVQRAIAAGATLDEVLKAITDAMKLRDAA
jgi:hypothetical protein